jgi:hypothetical protein
MDFETLLILAIINFFVPGATLEDGLCEIGFVPLFVLYSFYWYLLACLFSFLRGKISGRT